LRLAGFLNCSMKKRYLPSVVLMKVILKFFMRASCLLFFEDVSHEEFVSCWEYNGSSTLQ
jgi:hypothetical protein